jgi:hypothetical protein
LNLIGIDNGKIALGHKWFSANLLAVWAGAFVQSNVWHFEVSAPIAEEPLTICPRRHEFKILAFDAVGAANGIGCRHKAKSEKP